jgi:hypothetical protein
VDGWGGESAGSGRACRPGKVLPPSRETLTCGVAAIKGVTERQAASAPSRERPSETEFMTLGVSAGGSVDLARWPVSLATVVGFQFGIRSSAAKQKSGSERTVCGCRWMAP